MPGPESLYTQSGVDAQDGHCAVQVLWNVLELCDPVVWEPVVTKGLVLNLNHLFGRLLCDEQLPTLDKALDCMLRAAARRERDTRVASGVHLIDERGQFGGAVRAFDAALHHLPAHGATLAMRAASHYRCDQLAEAIEDVRAALAATEEES